jgi:hypothetical protein
MRSKIYSALLILAIFSTVSCTPTYPREKIEEGVRQLCKKEYGVDVEVKVVGKTLGVRIPLEGLFDTQTLQISPKAFEKVDGVMLSVSRVALSSDKSIDFYVVITYDKKVPGAEVVMTRYVPDLRRYVFGDISRGEFTKRMVFDVRFNPQGIIDTWLGGFTLKETGFEEFITQQASRRIADEFRENNKLVGKFKLASCEGKLQNNIYNFTVDISREGLPMSELIHGTAWHDKVLEVCLQVISYILYFYDVKGFEKVNIYNKFDNKNIEIGRSDIKKWYKRSIEID